MTHEQLLLELKGLSPPTAPGWWLLAPGQILVILLLLSLIAVLWMVLRRRKSMLGFIAAKLELERIRSAHLNNGNAQQLTRELAQWLKRVALLAFPESRLEGVTGLDWLSFLDDSLGDVSFTRGEGSAFAGAVYQRQAQPDIESLLSLCDRWLQAVKPQLLRRGQR